jgi:hypothetical protein
VIDYLRRTPTLARLLRSTVGGLVRFVCATVAIALFAPDGMSDGDKYIAVIATVAMLYAWDVHDEVTKRRDAR